MFYWSLDLKFKARLKLSRNLNIQYGRQVAILKVTSMKIHRLLPIHTSIVLLMCGLGIQRVQKEKNPISPPGGHFESDIAECQYPVGFLPCTQVICYWSIDMIVKAKLEYGNWKIQYGHQAVILKVTSLKTNMLLPIATNNTLMKFEIEIPKQTWVTPWKPCHLQNPDIAKSNMATMQPFWKGHCWKSTGSFLYTQVMCYWSLDLIFKAKLKLEYGKWNKPIWLLDGDSLLKIVKTTHKWCATEVWTWYSKPN